MNIGPVSWYEQVGRQAGLREYKRREAIGFYRVAGATSKVA